MNIAKIRKESRSKEGAIRELLFYLGKIARNEE